MTEQIESSQLLKVIDQTGKTIYRVQVPRRHTASARAPPPRELCPSCARAVPEPPLYAAVPLWWRARVLTTTMGSERCGLP